MKYGCLMKRGVSVLLAAAVAVTALPVTDISAKEVPKDGFSVQVSNEKPQETGEEEVPFYRLVKKGGASKSGYQEMVWVDENGNEAEGESSYEDTGSIAMYSLRETFPSSYNMADLGELPAVRNQGKWGTCWAHAAISSIESNMIKKGLADVSEADYSERHLSYFAHRRDVAMGDGEDSYDETYKWYGGGNYHNAINLLSGWCGAAAESEFPYVSYGDMPDLEESQRRSSVSHLTDASILSTAEDVKRAVTENGAVMCSFYSGDGTFNTAQVNVYHAEEHSTDHAVSIVGWDDDYSRTNFNDSGRIPAENGAWFCRNSWGADWAEDGYFWISYEDKTLSAFCSFEAEKADNYDNIYQYNGAGGNLYVGCAKTANMFCTDSAEELKAVSVYVYKNYDYVIEVYVEDGESMGVPSDGTLVYSGKGTLEYPGYHVIPLERSILLGSGMKYAVAVQLIAKEGDTAFSYMETNENYSAGRGQSFIYANEWIDTADYTGLKDIEVKNTCINAFTDNVQSVNKARLLQAIEEAENENLQESDYTAATWADYANARENAQTVYQSSDPGEREILKAVTKLAYARNALKEAIVLITDEIEFESFMTDVLSGNDYKDQTVRLLSDLDMTGIHHTAAGDADRTFQGTFDGENHSITNVSYQYVRFYGGLFGHIGESGTVKNINVSYDQFEARGSYSGGIAGKNQGTVSNCKVTGEDLQFKAVWTGGIVGMNEGTVRDCQAAGNFSFDCNGGTVGGIVGYNTGTIETSFADGSVRFLNQTDPEQHYAGGIAGFNQGMILKCFTRGEITSDSAAAVGGIVGYSDANSVVSLCYNLASVGGEPAEEVRTAGIGVCLYGNTDGCYNYGSISRSGSGIYGAIYCFKGYGTVANCYYLDTSSEKGGYTPDFSEGKRTEADFASAKTAYDLNSNGGTGENTGIWSQSQEEHVPILADSKHRAVIRVTVRQSESSRFQASLNGVVNGVFYARAGGTVKLLPESAADEPGYTLAARVEGLTCLEEEENTYILPDTDVQAVIDCQKELINYSIIYHPDRGTGAGQKTYNVESEVELFTPVREGAEFLGWYDNEALQGEPVEKIPEGSTGNKEFWAKWYREGYEVFFPEKSGYEIKSCDGYVNGKIQDGDSYLFTAAAQTGYDISNLVIRYGDTQLTSADGVYRIDNIMSDIDNISVSGIKLKTGNYTAESYNGYVGETCTIRPSAPATGIRLEAESEFSDSITVDTDNDVTIVTCDDDGNISDAERILFEKDLTAPDIASVEVLPENSGDHFAGVYITVSADDAESGVSEYSFDNGGSWQEENRYYVMCAEEERIFGQTVLVRDYVGNTAVYDGEIMIPAFVKYNTSVKLFADKPGYLPGEDIVLRADVTFEEMEDAESYGNVHFLSSGGEVLQSAQVWPISDTVGRAQIIISGGTVSGQREAVFYAAYDGTATIYQDSESEECRVWLASARIKNPVFADIEVEQGTQTAAGAADLGSGILPVSGTVMAGGMRIPYRIAWNPSVVLDLTKEGSSAVFTGTITYENVPVQILLPETSEVSRKVTVKKSGAGYLNPIEQEKAFKNGAAEETGPAIYQVIDAKKRTAVLLKVKNKNITALNVPAEVKICGETCKVVQIGKKAAKGCKNLKKVILGKNVVTIGEQAFYNCKKLKTVQMKGKAIKTVKKKAFKNTAAKITVRAKKLNKKQKAALLRKLKTAGISKKAKVK